MSTWDLFLALLLPLPPWIGFLVYRARGRVGLSYGYFLGGSLSVMALPWPLLGSRPLPSAELGGALCGFALFVVAYREGRHGIRRLALGIGGATLFSALLLTALGLGLRSLGVFWVVGIAQAALLLLFSDIAYRLTHGRWLHLRLPVVSGVALLTVTALQRLVFPGQTPFPWMASAIAGPLLGLVVLQHLLYMRDHGTWVEGRGEGFRTALAALERSPRPEGPSLELAIETHQPVMLVNGKGLLVEGNSAFGRLVGLPRHLLRGYELGAFLQGGDKAVWEDLRDQLLRRGQGRAAAALVRRDGAFEAVELEAAAFDLNLALVWLKDPHAPGIALEEDRTVPGIRESLDQGSRRTVNALGTLVPAAEFILAETQNPRIREAAELILMATQRLGPDHASPRARLSAPAFLQEQLGRLNRMMPRDIRVVLRAEAVELGADPDPLRRILTHLALHARQGLVSGQIRILAGSAPLMGRPWATLSVEREGPRTPARERFLGLGWLLQAVHSCRGRLDLWRDHDGHVWPRVWLPMPGTAGTQEPANANFQDLRIWIVDQDPLVRETLDHLARSVGAQVEQFPDLRGMLQGSRTRRSPDLLVMERTPQLERFRRVLHKLRLVPVPMLLLASGPSLGESDPVAFDHSRVVFLEKPFPRKAFLECLDLLLNQTPGPA